MHIKIFMATADEVYQQELLRNFGQGIQNSIVYDDSESYIEEAARIEPAIPSDDKITVDFDYGYRYSQCDIAVLFGSWKPREKQTHQVRTEIVNKAPNFVVIETPLLKRTTSEDNTYYRVGVNGYLSRDAVWAKMKDTEAQVKLDSYNINWAGWQHNQSGPIIFSLQLPGDASLRGTDIIEWAFVTITKLRQETDKKIILRGHPLASEKSLGDYMLIKRKCDKANIKNVEFVDGQTKLWKDQIRTAYCTITYASGMAVDSVLSGIPTIAVDAGNFAYGISSNNVRQINNLKLVDKQVIHKWLLNMVKCQWSEKEMFDGTTWKYLKSWFIQEEEKDEDKDESN